jgi:hypothetical protein
VKSKRLPKSKKTPLAGVFCCRLYSLRDLGQLLELLNMKNLLIVGTLVVLLMVGMTFWGNNRAESPTIEKSEVEVINEGATTTPASQGKIDVKVACESALTYTTFASGEEADVFMAECMAGAHPEVIERYIEELGLESGATI